jgi:hypothetical protein
MRSNALTAACLLSEREKKKEHRNCKINALNSPIKNERWKCSSSHVRFTALSFICTTNIPTNDIWTFNRPLEARRSWHSAAAKPKRSTPLFLPKPAIRHDQFHPFPMRSISAVWFSVLRVTFSHQIFKKFCTHTLFPASQLQALSFAVQHLQDASYEPSGSSVRSNRHCPLITPLLDPKTTADRKARIHGENFFWSAPLLETKFSHTYVEYWAPFPTQPPWRFLHVTVRYQYATSRKLGALRAQPQWDSLCNCSVRVQPATINMLLERAEKMVITAHKAWKSCFYEILTLYSWSPIDLNIFVTLFSCRSRKKTGTF